MPINETHDPNLRSWVESANDPATDFPIQNLPLVRFWAEGDDYPGYGMRLGLPIGDQVLDLSATVFTRQHYKFGELDAAVKQFGLDHFAAVDGVNPMLNVLARGSEVGSRIRRLGQLLLRYDCPIVQDDVVLRPQVMRSLASIRPEPLLESIANYTDFYASLHHASTVGSMFRPDNPLLPNYKHVPIGYHGRASSIVVSGTPVRRPRGQLPPPDDQPAAGPTFGPTRMLDYELEVGALIGPANELGRPVPIARAADHICGLCLVNDWSARDIQKWEYQPLGPFLAKNFATTISPYIVTLEALEPFRCPAFRRPPGDPAPLPYLLDESDQARGGFDITLEVHLQSAQMRDRHFAPVLLSRSRAFKDMYWTLAQLLAHHTSNGCNLQSGDLLASGTVSGPGPAERGCLLELTWQGRGPDGKPLPRKPIDLPTGEKRLFLEDGDEVTFKGYCERDGFRRIGFGECRGRISAASDGP